MSFRWHRVEALLYKYFCICKNRLDRVFDLFFWPVVELMVWGFVSGFIAERTSGVNFLTIFLSGLILWSFVWATTRDLSIFVLEDYWGRNLYNQYASPVTTGELLASLLLWASMRTIITFSILVLVASALYKFSLFAIGWYAALFGSLLLLFGWAAGMFLAAMVFRFGMRFQVLTWSLTFLLMPFSCVFYPLAALPVWAQNIAKLLPTTYIFESLRSLILTGSFEQSFLIRAVLITLILLVLAGFLFALSIESARKRGDFTRYA